jgi:hypothetical protein
MNAKLLNAGNTEWCVLVEIGKPAGNPLISMALCATGIDRIYELPVYPIRLVHPTADELAAYRLQEGTASHA